MKCFRIILKPVLLLSFISALVGCSKQLPSAVSELSETSDLFVSQLLNSTSELAGDEVIVVEFDPAGNEVNRRIVRIDSTDSATPNLGALPKTLLTGLHEYVTPCLGTTQNSNGTGALGVSFPYSSTHFFWRGAYIGQNGAAGSTWFVAANTFPAGSVLQTYNETQVTVYCDDKYYTRGFGLLPIRQWGKKYIAPRLSGNAQESRLFMTVTAAAGSTGAVYIGGSRVLLSGAYNNVFNVLPGTIITSSDSPIQCTAWIDVQNYCRGATLDPID